MTAAIVYQKFSECGRFNLLIERQTSGVYSNCFEVYLYDKGVKQGANAFPTFPEALDFVYSTMKAHKREGIEYNQ